MEIQFPHTAESNQLSGVSSVLILIKLFCAVISEIALHLLHYHEEIVS